MTQLTTEGIGLIANALIARGIKNIPGTANSDQFLAFAFGATLDRIGSVAAAITVASVVTGATDNAAAIQAAIAARSALGGGQVLIPPGVYQFSGITMARNIVIVGAGIGVTTLLYTGAGIGITFTGTGDRWESGLQDLTLQTTLLVPPYAGTYGVRFTDVLNCRLTRVEITGWATAGVNVNGTVSCLSGVIENCNIHENNGGIYTSGGNNVLNHWVIRDSKVRASQHYNLYNTQDCLAWSIFGTNMEAGVLGSVYWNGAGGLTIAGCYFEQTASANAILLGDTRPATGVSIRGNIILGTGIANGVAAIRIGVSTNPTGVDVSANDIRAWQVGVDAQGLGSGQLGPNAFTSVGTEYLYPFATLGAFAIGDFGAVRGSAGAPNNANGTNGDIYLRSDTPGTANQRVYIKSAGAWVGIV